MDDDEAKRIVLARRARFIAAAMAGVAAAACDRPRACLEPPMVTTTAPTYPAVCLSPTAIPKPDAGTENASASDASTDDAMIGPPAPPPRVCLRK